MKTILCVMVFFFSSVVGYAADIPTVVAGSKAYDEKTCIARYANECITSVCLTSQARDCIQKCQDGAKDKCKEQSE